MRFRQQVIKGFIINKTPAPNRIFYLQIYTKDQGHITAKVKVSQKLTNRFQGKLELLSLSDFTIYKSNNNLSISAINNTKNQHLDQISPAYYNLITTICDTSRRILPPEDPIHKIYTIFQEVHTGLINKYPAPIIHIFFLSQIFKTFGILPHLKTCPTCQKPLAEKSSYDPRKQEIFCKQCSTTPEHPTTLRSRKAIHYATTTPLTNLNLIQIDETTKQETLNLLNLILTNYIEG